MEMLRESRHLFCSPQPLLQVNPCTSRIRPLLLKLGTFCSPSSDASAAKLALPIPLKGLRVSKASATRLKERWLRSISSPLGGDGIEVQRPPCTEWVVGIDPDTSGAVALLKFDDGVCSAQVFDTPHLKIMVGKRARKRPDARSIVKLLHSFGAPLGTVAYIEQSTPFPGDGKQGWWCGGYTYGLWIGILVSSGYSVVPVPSRVWKDHFELSGTTLTKDDSRKAASLLFPSVSSVLKRKKDHATGFCSSGRAEALLIAAYGKGLRVPPWDLDTGTTDI